MTIDQSVHDILHRTLTGYVTDRRPGQLVFSRNIPYLTKQEAKLLAFITDDAMVRPRCYLKRNGEYTSLTELLIPKEYSLYSKLFLRQNYHKTRNSLIGKRLLYDTDYGMVLNHAFVPFSNSKTMLYLVKIAQIPLPPMQI